MKKMIALSLSLILAFLLAACGGGTLSEAPSGNGVSTEPREIDLSGEISGEINVSTYNSMMYRQFLEEAAERFMQKHPGVQVNVETFSAMPEIRTSESGGARMSAIQLMDDPQGRADYINKVGAALMSGGGADVLAMDVLPVDKYATSGMLENLNDYINSDPDFRRSDYRQNVLDAAQYKGGLWFMPIDYGFNYYAYDTTLLPGQESAFGTGSAFTAQELIDKALPSFNGSAMLFNSPSYISGLGSGSSLFAQMLEENYTTFVDIANRRANFKDGGFAELLTTVKEYAESELIPQGVTGQRDPGEMMRRMGEDVTERYFYKSKNNFSLVSQYSRGTGMQIRMGGGALAGIEDDDEIAGIRADADGGVPFTYQQAYAINSNSDNKQAAWEFIKFLLSEEMQSSTALSPISMPMRQSVREEKIESVFNGGMFRGMGGPGGGFGNPGGPGAPEGPGGQSAQRERGQDDRQTSQGDPDMRQAGGQQPLEPPESPDEPTEPEDPEESKALQDLAQQRQAEGGPAQGMSEEVMLEAIRKYLEAESKLADQINTFVIKDTTINDMIASEVQYFFEGSKTADEVTTALQNRVDLYLSE